MLQRYLFQITGLLNIPYDFRSSSLSILFFYSLKWSVDFLLSEFTFQMFTVILTFILKVVYINCLVWLCCLMTWASVQFIFYTSDLVFLFLLFLIFSYILCDFCRLYVHLFRCLRFLFSLILCSCKGSYDRFFEGFDCFLELIPRFFESFKIRYITFLLIVDPCSISSIILDSCFSF